MTMLRTATQNFVEATANKLQRNKTYWNLVAKQIDTISRFFFPSLYLISMIVRNMRASTGGPPSLKRSSLPFLQLPSPQLDLL